MWCEWPKLSMNFTSRLFLVYCGQKPHVTGECRIRIVFGQMPHVSESVYGLQFFMWTEITHLKVCIIISMADGSDSLLWYRTTTHWSLTIGYKSLLMYVARDAIGYCGPWPQQPEVSRLAIIIFIATACGFFLQ